MSKKILPDHLHAAHEWTRAAGELETLRRLDGDELDAYVRASVANAAAHGAKGVSEVTLTGLHVWLWAVTW